MSFCGSDANFRRDRIIQNGPRKDCKAYGLAANHAFIDGNKRIGAMMTQLLLKWNGYSLSLNPGELADMFISIADGKTSEKDLLQWIKDKTR
ncbi:MAG: type II toxin-antitoxin system death-on-curing family toxin [Clostridia bacterium]|nr:type II toxin-antitoxin system death-on-curing family toxin [Clostridia bacterium]